MRTAERGSISVALIAGTLLFCLCALAAADVGAMVFARARAQAGADTAALAAVVNQVEILRPQQDPADAAASMAMRNGVDLLRCDCSIGRTTARVEVATSPRLVFLTGWMGRRVTAEAVAAVDPSVLTYREG